MKLLEIKNNLIKVSYRPEEPVALGKFMAVTDAGHSYVAQIVNLKADLLSNYAVAKLQFTLTNDGVIDNYDGSIPSLKSGISIINNKEILSLLPVERPIIIGKLAQQEEILQLDQTLLEKNLTVCVEKFDNINLIVNNFVSQLEQINEKAVVIDIDHTFNDFEPIRFNRDFKLPLNSRMLDYIFENELDDIDSSNKTSIQNILYEVQEYLKTVEFIPFNTFINVVSQQYQSTQMPELALLKNKLLHLQENNIFAQTQDDVDALKKAILAHAITYIDIASADDKLQNELIGYIHNVMSLINGYSYLFVKLSNQVGNKKILKQILNNDYVFTNILCNHNYKYLSELKNKAENLILFAPQTVQHDFASYNTFLNKLNVNEFIVYGTLTQNIPFIVELDDTTDLKNNLSDDLENNSYEGTITTVDDTQAQEELLSSETTDDTIETPDSVDDSVDVSVDDPSPDIITNFNDLIKTPEETNPVQFEQMEKVEFLPDIDTNNTVQEIENDTIIDQFEPIEPENELIEQVARDVDKVFYNNIIEKIPPIEAPEIIPEDNLTEDDLNFIDELPHSDYIQNQDNLEVSNEQLDNLEDNINLQFEDTILADSEDFENISPSNSINEVPDDFQITEEVEPDLPIYPSETPMLKEGNPSFMQGDTITHPKYGKGVIEKIIKYGNKTLCSISFENTGKKLLDPAISELEKI